MADTTEEAVETFYAPYAAVMTQLGRERGWPPMSRAQFDAMRGPEGSLAVGSPEEVAAKLVRVQRLLGLDRVLLHLSVGTMPHAAVLRAVELLGAEVAPAVRDAAAAAAGARDGLARAALAVAARGGGDGSTRRIRAGSRCPGSSALICAMANGTAPTYRLRRCRLADGERTTLYVVRHALEAVRPRVHVFPQPRRLDHWCWRSGVRDAIVGGFYLRDPFRPLGEVRVDGEAVPGTAFPAEHHPRRPAFHAVDGRVAIAPRGRLAEHPGGDLLQAGPLLLEDAVFDDGDAALLGLEHVDQHFFLHAVVFLTLSRLALVG